MPSSAARCLDANSQTGLQLFQLLNHFIQVFDPEQIYLAPEKCKIEKIEKRNYS